jgi:hypothetical protein
MLLKRTHFKTLDPKNGRCKRGRKIPVDVCHRGDRKVQRGPFFNSRRSSPSLGRWRPISTAPYTGRGRCRAGNHGAISEGGPERLPGSSSRGAISVSLEGWRQRRHSAFSPSDSNPTHRAISRAAIHRLCPVHIAGTVKIFADGPRTRVIVRCAIDSGLDWRRN